MMIKPASEALMPAFLGQGSSSHQGRERGVDTKIASPLMAGLLVAGLGYGSKTANLSLSSPHHFM